MKNMFTKTRIKYLVGLMILIGILVGGYYFYGYYKEHFVEPYFVFVRFNSGVSQEKALAVLEKYQPGISAKTPENYDPENPTNYDLADLASYEKFEQVNIQFKVEGYYRSKSIMNALTQEPTVDSPKSLREIEFLEKILAYFFN